nr:FmdB family zinc ribbon protein [Petropleomorpha daqingensis]
MSADAVPNGSPRDARVTLVVRRGRGGRRGASLAVDREECQFGSAHEERTTVPTYQYVCTNPDGKHDFELVQSFTDEPASECPTCGSSVRKVYGSVGVVFKGSGFYRTDSRAAAGKSSSSGGSSSSSSSTSSSSSDSSSSSSSTSSSSSSNSSSSSGTSKAAAS